MIKPIPQDSVRVSPSRLNRGYWCHASNREKDRGDISASYSADLIALEGRICKPFLLHGALHVTVGLAHLPEEHAEAYRLVELSQFDGEPTSYGQRNKEEARNSPDGFYHGMTVRHGKQTYVLNGPPVILCGGDPEPVQESLF